MADLWVPGDGDAGIAGASAFRKADPPVTGDRYGSWGSDPYIARLPGGSVMQFDLSRLTLEDFRTMREDYQINASLLMLQMMIAQCDWQIVTKGEETDPKAKKISQVIEEGIRKQWIPLVRAMSTAFWAGFAPTALVYELNNDDYYEVTKYKDLVPENTAVDWETTDGADGVKIRTYSGIVNSGKKIPGKNTLWYPLMMENGNHYGRKLLTPAFPPWFFSQLMHLWTNRYFERFGEPTAVGRYPADTTISDPVTGAQTSSRDVMAGILTNLRSRGVVTMPSDVNPETNQPEWDINYLESQMRGADFDRYLARLDEEKSLALFTPVLMFRTGEAGSYNLGTLHTQVFQWMLNAITGDMKSYLDHYLIKPLHDINFGPNAPLSQIRFRTLGRLQDQGAQSILLGLIQNGGAKVTETGLSELGAHLGIELEYLTGSATAPTAPSVVQGPAEAKVAGILNGPDPSRTAQRAGVTPNDSRGQLTNASRRLADQVHGIFSKKDGFEREFALANVKMGFKGAFLAEMTKGGADPALAESLFTTIERDVRAGLVEARSEPDALSALRSAFADYGVDVDR